MQSSVSVVIPAYNCAKFLPDCLGSVFKQSVAPTEIIVIDDGSTDDTSRVLAEFSSRVVVISQENRGAAAARNRGIEQASGDWVAFLDADDLWVPEKTAWQLAAADANPRAVAIYGQMQNFEPDGCLADILPERLALDENDTSLIESLACLLGMPPTPTILARRDALREAGMFPVELATAEDLDLWVRMMAIGPFVGVPQIVMHRRLRHDSLTATHHGIKQYSRYLQICLRRREVIRKWAGSLQRSGPPYIHTCLAKLHLDNSDRPKALWHAALGLWPKHPQRSFAFKLVLESLLGSRVYNWLSASHKQRRTTV